MQDLDSHSSPSCSVTVFIFPKDVYKSDICVVCPLSSEVDVLFNWVMVISTQAISWLIILLINLIVWSHLVRSFPRFPSFSVTLQRGALGLRILTISYTVPRCSWSMGSNSHSWLLPNNKIPHSWLFVFPNKTKPHICLLIF